MWCGVTRHFRRREPWTITSPVCARRLKMIRTSRGGLKPCMGWGISWSREHRSQNSVVRREDKIPERILQKRDKSDLEKGQSGGVIRMNMKKLKIGLMILGCA